MKMVKTLSLKNLSVSLPLEKLLLVQQVKKSIARVLVDDFDNGNRLLLHLNKSS